MKFGILLLLLSLTLTARALPTPATAEYTITQGTLLSCDESLTPLCDYLRTYLPIGKAHLHNAAGSIALQLDPALDSEAYRLYIDNNCITISGGDYGGVFYGIQHLFRLLPPEIYTGRCPLPLTVSCTQITNAPKFHYRGMMLDLARTWINGDQVKRYINLLSYHNINKLHLHLSDDEGWRIEIKSHPELTKIGGFRGGDSPVRAVYGKWGEKYGGYFTQEQMRDIIRYAAIRNIEIIPEIDLPGHSRNIAQLHPEILCRYTPDTTCSNGYDQRSAWCVAREDNYKLLSDILGEICELFPSPYIHVGGDEVELSQWRQCPDCQALMRQNNMTTPDQLEYLFMSRVAKILTSHGKLPGVWNEAINGGGLSHASRVYGWKSVKACLKSTSAGYQTVVMPGDYFYFDMRQSPHEKGHDWAAIFDAQKTLSFDFAKCGFSAEQLRHVVGLEAAFWSETYVSNNPEKPDYLDYMCFPRICALALLAWRGTGGVWSDFYHELLSVHYDRMAAMGIRFRLWPPTVTYTNGYFSATVNDGAIIYYTDDGLTEPTAESKRYTTPIRTRTPHLYQFRSVRKTGQSPIVTDASFYRTITPALRLTTSMGASSRIPLSNVEGYKTFARTQRACRQGDWICYTFAAPLTCREILLQTGHRQMPKTIVTTGRVEISSDGRHFTTVGELEKGSITLRPQQPLRAIRVVSTCDDNGCSYVTIQPLMIKPLIP